MKEESISYDVIAKLLIASAYKEEIEGDEQSKRSWDSLKRSFPDLSFSEKNFSFINAYNGKIVPISGLLTRPFFKPIDQKTSRFDGVQNDVNYLLNRKTFLADITGKKYFQEKVDMVNNAIQRRNDHCASAFGHERYCTASDKICGTFKLDSMHFIVISNKPIDIFMKSTGRAWEDDSCERVRGPYENGIYSDIEWSNCIALLYKKSDKKNPIGRVMIRTCEDHESGKPSFGIEPIWYTIKGRQEDDGSVDGIDIFDLRSKLVTIITEKGFSMDYDTCITPYKYMGFSDKMEHGRTEITYGEMRIDVKEILKRDVIIQIGSMCPFCDVIFDWTIEFDFKNTSDESIEASFDEKEGEIINDFFIKNASIDEIEFDFYSVVADPPEDDECPRCQVSLLHYHYDKEQARRFGKMLKILKSTKEKHGGWWKPRFLDCTIKSKISVLAEQSSIQEHFMKEMEEYKALVKRIKASNDQDRLARFIMSHEMDKGRKAATPKNKRNAVPSSIKMISKYNIGAQKTDMEQDEVILYVNDEEMDHDAIVEEYVRAVYPESMHDELLAKGQQKIDTSKFKKLSMKRT